MHITVEPRDDHAVLYLRGEFDTFYCPALMQEVEALVERGTNHLVLDMRLVKFINSTALGAVIKAHKRCRAEGGDLVIAQPSPFVRDVINKVGIDKLIAMHATDQDAVKAIIKHLNQRELAGDAPVDHEKVMITFEDEIRNKMIGGKKTLLGTISNVDGGKLVFLWNGSKSGISADQAKQLFFKGSEAHLRFQVKMIKKSFFELRGKVRSLTEQRDVEFVRTDALRINEIELGQEIASLHLAPSAAGWVLQLLGKTGEPRPDMQVNVILEHLDFTGRRQTSLQTDARGRIELGELREIKAIEASFAGGSTGRWPLVRSEASLPARMHSEYLRRLYLNNDLAEGRYQVGGRPVAIADIEVPMLIVGTVRDHVAPWPSVYKMHLLSDAELTFVLTSGGHNAGVVSEPGHPRRSYQIATRSVGARYVDPQTWRTETPLNEGSWWPAWQQWLARHSTERVSPPAMGGTQVPLGDAPGTYVAMR